MSDPYPSSPGFESIDFRGTDPNIEDVTPAGQQHVRGLGGQWWHFTVRYRSLRREAFAPVQAFIAALGGRRGTFTITLPTVSDKSGNASGAITVSGPHAVGDDTVLLNPFSGTLKAGDMVKFAHDKVYMIRADLTGGGELSIYPPLIRQVADLEAVTYDAVPFLCRLDNDVQEWSLRNDARRTFEVDMREAV